MSHHRASVSWSRAAETAFTYEAYPRDHRVTFGGGATFGASAAPEYKGTAELPNPEEMMVAALSSCHMLTFLAICAKKGVGVDRYEDEAEGHLEKNAEGRLAVTRVTLQPHVDFSPGVDVDDAALAKLHEASHRGCFIAASVTTKITVSPRR